MAKYKARGGGGYFLIGTILVIAIGLVALTAWLIIRSTPPTVCDVNVTGAKLSPVADDTGKYPVTVTYSSNGSDNCSPDSRASITVYLTDYTKKPPVTVTIPPPSTLPLLSAGSYVVHSDNSNSVVSLDFNIVNPDGSVGPVHKY